MTTSADWPQGVEPMPSIEPSSDLFDGDILGDELIDIYNAAVVGSEDDSAMNEIPTLLAPTPESGKKGVSHIQPAPPNTSSAPSPADDGLGAFRPSTSFNDLTTLLPPQESTVPSENAKKMTSVVSTTVVQGSSLASLPETKKRSIAAAPSDAPASKRRLSGNKKTTGSVSSKSKGTKVGSVRGSSQGKEDNDTPNPLTIVGQFATSSKGISSQPAKPISNPAAVPASSAAVVTPRVPTKVTEAPIAATAPPPPIAAAPTEADFKSVAQAAVSNLILNAGNSKADSSKKAGAGSDTPSEKIDTSTEHIKALTGSNWVAVCAGGDNAQANNASNDKINNRARRQNLTPDERARQNRDRNREHARNTRLRKKAYVEELKRTLTALVTQRDANDLEKRHAAQRELEQREVRFRVIEEFLKLRGRNEVNFARWAAILEENFVLSLPHTDYREMVVNDRRQFEQVISGVSQVMADSTCFSSFLQTLSKVPAGGVPISFSYNCDRKNFFMDNCTAVMDWTACSNGALNKGAQSELTLKGSLKARFSPASNKLISVEFTFDTGIVMSQLNHAFKAINSPSDEIDEDAAAQVAASEADAILDSLQMPHIATSTVPSNVTVVPRSAPVSVTDGEKSDSSDESNGDGEDNCKDVAARRVLRVRKD